jgi:hypothetical protein
MDLHTSRLCIGDEEQLAKLDWSCRQDMPGVLKSKAAFVPTAGKTLDSH